MMLLLLAVTLAAMPQVAQVQALAALMRGLPPGLDGLTNPGLPGTEAANLIGSQFNELASLLGRAKEASEAGQTLLASPPAYVKRESETDLGFGIRRALVVRVEPPIY
eukprot:s2182_g3.t1